MCISDYAVSSYIPTVNTLLEKLKNSAKGNSSDTKMLLISQPNTPGLSKIPATTIETQVIQHKMEQNTIEALLLEGEEATTSRTGDALKSHQWVHFACHALQNAANRLQSGFYLQDGQLQLMQIIRQQLPNAEFAFLSACQTSVGDEKLSNEAVHLAAGMLAAGFQGVVGTMWSIGDEHAPKIADYFYSYLLEQKRGGGSGRLESRAAAFALDDAIRKIRSELGDNEQSFLTWVPYIHYGL